MASASKDTIIIRVKSSTKKAAKRAAKTDKLTLTEYLTRLILKDQPQEEKP
jgi:uncharacterized protein (DUF1778 family)